MTTAPTPLGPREPSAGPPPLDPALFRGRLGISVEEFARATGLSRTSAYLAVQRGDVPSRLVGRRRIIPLPALFAWLAAGDAA